MFAITAPLRRNRLITFSPAQPFNEAAIRIDEAVLDRLLGQLPPDRTIPIRKSGHYRPEIALIRHSDDPGPLPYTIDSASSRPKISSNVASSTWNA